MEKSLNKLFFIFIVFACLGSCKKFQIIKTLGPLDSKNIEESKKIGVFLWEYKPVNIKIGNDSLEIKEAFAEKAYRYNWYDDLENYVIWDSLYSVKVLFKDPKRIKNILKEYDFTKSKKVSINNEKYICLGLSNKTKYFFRRYYNNFPHDTIFVMVTYFHQDSVYLLPKEDRRAIGDFVLIRKF